jgi:peptide chain release factor 2
VKAGEINKKISHISKTVTLYDELVFSFNYYLEELNGEDLSIIEKEINTLEESLIALETKIYLNGPYDELDVYIEIRPGAGGTEASDWAGMLTEMYLNYFKKENIKYEILEKSINEEAGIKNALIKVSADYIYGYLKHENGIHRLVRISPFDSNKRRHTSFASVLVTPIFKNNINININDSDLKIDTFYSSGAGGQSVNTTESAIRITHLPTKTVVTYQNERSQIKNKEKAMEILKNKLYKLELEKEEERLNKVKKINKIDFGMQIRSYVLEPYKLVKDYRSNFESTSPEALLSGDIKEMLEYNLRSIKNE